jgi:hypothetical protein
MIPRIGHGVMLLVLAGVLAGCPEPHPEQEPIVINIPADGGDGRVSLKELLDPSDPAAAMPSMARRLFVRMLLYERSDPRLAIATDMLDDPPIGVQRLQLWRENGFRFGVTDRSRIPLLLGNLPRPIYSQTSVFYGAVVFSPLTLVDKVNGATRVKLIEADGSASFRCFIGGRYQALLRLLPPKEGQPSHLELLPHHHSPLRSLMLRTPEQQVMEGHRFEQLRVYHPIGPEEVWVITADPAAASGGPVTNSAGGPRSGESQSLAQVMLTGRSRDKDVQILLLLWLEEEEPKP